ncbi:MAG TPA: succinyl-diaminopimelate desuccinylase [Gammaproteobacteria bacterium]|nr:succinyl-diaminopimelate desuccinylase [Gammaproteobacteria bacterium]
MTIALARQLVACPSVTPEDGGCQDIIARRLEHCGFTVTHPDAGNVKNLWAIHGHGEPVLAMLGHTDVVPAGEQAAWASDPFVPEIRDGHLFGRGAADMKGSVAAMVTAMESFVEKHPRHSGTLALLLTSDEEGEAINGTRKVMERLDRDGVRIKWCLVGEPSSRERLGDVIKVGRRGSLNATLHVLGVQGHVAHPARARNPIHEALPALLELRTRVWDRGNQYYPPTSFQISNIHGGTGADNVIPGNLTVLFNFRYSTEVTEEALKRETAAILTGHKLEYRIEWRSSGLPFLTQSGRLLEAVRRQVLLATGIQAVLSTDGGTSDGRFVAPTGAEVIELGPLNATIHKVNECVCCADLEDLSRIYTGIIAELLTQAA